MCHVLIIEDECRIASTIEAMLKAEGATTFDVATTEADAVRAALAHPPHLITSDVMLEAGTGPKAVAAIHRTLGPVPVIFITGSPEACQPCWSGIVLTKPFRPEQLTQAYRALCDRILLRGCQPAEKTM